MVLFLFRWDWIHLVMGLHYFIHQLFLDSYTPLLLVGVVEAIVHVVPHGLMTVRCAGFEVAAVDCKHVHCHVCQAPSCPTFHL